MTTFFYSVYFSHFLLTQHCSYWSERERDKDKEVSEDFNASHDREEIKLRVRHYNNCFSSSPFQFVYASPFQKKAWAVVHVIELVGREDEKEVWKARFFGQDSQGEREISRQYGDVFICVKWSTASYFSERKEKQLKGRRRNRTKSDFKVSKFFNF